jgi:hypothetical protein
MATFYAEGKVDLTILLMILGMQKSPKNVWHICLISTVVLFMSLEMMLMIIIVLSKIQYNKRLFQILMGSIGMSR